jgi:hypothetical protein
VFAPSRKRDGSAGLVPGIETIEWNKAMTTRITRSRPTIVRKVEDKIPQASMPDEGKSHVTSKEAQGLNDEPATLRFTERNVCAGGDASSNRRHVVTSDDDDRVLREYNYSRLKKALGIDDDDFCEGIYQQLDNLLVIEDGTQNRRNFDFVLSVVRSSKPVDTLHAMQLVQMAVCQLSIMRQSEILLRPARYELPADVAIALHRADWDAGRMEKQRIKIDEHPVRQMAERMVTRLMQTFDMQLQTSISYRKAVGSLAKPQRVSASTDGAEAQVLSGDGTAAARQKTRKNPPAHCSRGLNGSHHSAAGFTDSSKPMNSINVQKGNGHASS